MREDPRAPGAPVDGVGRRRWYSSLYWRIALGLVAVLALLLAAEGAIFLWITERIAGSMPARSPERLAVLVASDVSAALAANPSLNLPRYVRDQYGHILQTFLVIMRDGRVASNHEDVPEELLAAVRADEGFRQFRRRPPRGARPRGPDVAAPGDLPPAVERRDPPPRGPGGRGWWPGIGRPEGGGRRGGEFAPIFARDEIVGRVAVLPGGPPFARVVRQFGPTIALVAGSVLIIGTALIALLVFGPTRRRLQEVQLATERLGAGDLSARAPHEGSDEVAAVARSFNRMADELTSRASALEASDKARRQLLADVSHELMTPLTAMRGYIETIAMPELQLDAVTRQRYIGIIMEETHRLERIIGDLLDLARLEGRGTPMRRERVGIATLFSRVAERHERELKERQITLVTRIAPGGEEAAGDPDRLEQALQNLAANAMRHTPAGGTIAMTATSAARGLSLTVRDTGEGIAAGHLPLIFDRFYKGDAARRASGGSGLGLSIVKAIVEAHGGSISARNDGGAVFEILLPAQS